jgi:hypothetical protein
MLRHSSPHRPACRECGNCGQGAISSGAPLTVRGSEPLASTQALPPLLSSHPRTSWRRRCRVRPPIPGSSSPASGGLFRAIAGRGGLRLLLAEAGQPATCGEAEEARDDRLAQSKTPEDARRIDVARRLRDGLTLLGMRRCNIRACDPYDRACNPGDRCDTRRRVRDCACPRRLHCVRRLHSDGDRLPENLDRVTGRAGFR